MAGHSSTTLAISLFVMLLFSTLSSASDMSIQPSLVIFCDLHNTCPFPGTCCCSKFKSEKSCSLWFCCPYEEATCCEDHKGCCQADHPVCHIGTQTCTVRMGDPLRVKAMNLIPAQQIQALEKSTS